MDPRASSRRSDLDKPPVHLNGASGQQSSHSSFTSIKTTVTNNGHGSNDFLKNGVLRMNGGRRSESSFATQNQDQARHRVEVSDEPTSTMLPNGRRSNLDAGVGANEPKEVSFSTPYSSSRELHVSFPSSSSSFSSNDDGGAEVLRCTSNASFRRRSSPILRTKTQSRLMDPPPPLPSADNSVKCYRSPGPSGQLRSGQLGRPSDIFRHRCCSSVIWE